MAEAQRKAQTTTLARIKKDRRDYIVDIEKLKSAAAVPDSNKDLLEHCEAVLDELPKLGLRTYRTRQAFMKYIEECANSRHGRFYRVHFKTGKVWDIVPPGSIAMGVRLRRDVKEPRFKHTPLGELWTEFVRLPRKTLRKAA